MQFSSLKPILAICTVPQPCSASHNVGTLNKKSAEVVGTMDARLPAVAGMPADLVHEKSIAG